MTAKGKTNKKWGQTDAWRSGYERIFGGGGAVDVPITEDEMYPVYFEGDADLGHKTIQLTDEEYARYQRAVKEFDAVQDMIRNKMKEANK
jgi:hypothetical protein